MNGICHVVGAGDFDPRLMKISEKDLVIAADAGFLQLKNAGISPHLYIGDGDSLGFVPKGFPVVVLPVVKDDTDTLAALREGLSRGYRNFRLYGALGGKRFSHSLANLQSLAFLHQNGAKGEILDNNCRISYLPKGEYTFSFSGGYFSLFAMEGEANVSIEGAKYQLSCATLSPGFPLGVSNEGKGEIRIRIHDRSLYLVRDGILLCPDGANT